MRSSLLPALACAVALIGGCASTPQDNGGAGATVGGYGGILLVPLGGDRPEAGATVQIAHLMAEAVGGRRYTAMVYNFDGDYEVGVEDAAETLAEEVAVAGTVNRIHAARLIESLGISHLLVIEAFAHDQRWDGTTKVTRVGVAAWLVDLRAGEIWEGRFEDEGKGLYKGYDYVEKVVVDRLASAIPPRM